MNFFMQHEYDLSVTKRTFSSVFGSLCMTAERRNCPARSYTVIQGKPERLTRQMLGQYNVAELSQQAGSLSKWGISMSVALAKTSDMTSTLPVINTSDRECLLRRRTTGYKTTGRSVSQVRDYPLPSKTLIWLMYSRCWTGV